MTEVLVAIPTRAKRDLRLLGRGMARLPPNWTATLFLNGVANEAHRLEALERETGIVVRWLSVTGYASTRNAILDHAQQYSAVVFFDDDQIPCLGWADALVDALKLQPEADAIVGPRVSVSRTRQFMAGEWCRAQFPSLERMELDGDGYTGNTLLRIGFLRSHHLQFSPRFDKHGGEDTAFFREFRGLGGKILYEPHALAFEFVDEQRLTFRGVFRSGQINARRNTLLTPGLARIVARIVGNSGRAAVALVAGVSMIDRRRLALGVRSMGMVSQYLRELARVPISGSYQKHPAPNRRDANDA